MTSRLVVGALALAFLIAPAALAQQRSDTDLLEEGQQLYEQNCALCHKDSGAGDPPTFPALSGSDQLQDPMRVVRSIRRGRGRMPPFPGLSAGELSSLATYVRTQWADDQSDVTTEEVAAMLDGLDEGSPMVSVWDGVFTGAQADRGKAVYEGACGTCHGYRLNGAPDDADMRSTPPLARARFLRVWQGRSLATLFEFTRATMPEDNPDSMSEQDYVDVIAYMLTVGGMPAGDDELQPDADRLARVILQPSRLTGADWRP